MVWGKKMANISLATMIVDDFFFLKAAGKQKILKKVLTNSASW